MKMSKVSLPHYEAAAKASPAFAAKIAPKAQMPEFKTRTPIRIAANRPFDPGVASSGWARKSGVKVK